MKKKPNIKLTPIVFDEIKQNSLEIWDRLMEGNAISEELYENKKELISKELRGSRTSVLRIMKLFRPPLRSYLRSNLSQNAKFYLKMNM